jgi:hypothetical protein
MDEQQNITDIKVQILINELIQITSELDIVEASLLVKLNEEDEQAQSVFDEAIIAATNKYRAVGEMIFHIGGNALMSDCIYRISNSNGAHSVINFAWSGIGNWQS